MPRAHKPATPASARRPADAPKRTEARPPPARTAPSSATKTSKKRSNAGAGSGRSGPARCGPADPGRKRAAPSEDSSSTTSASSSSDSSSEADSPAPRRSSAGNPDRAPEDADPTITFFSLPQVAEHVQGLVRRRAEKHEKRAAEAKKRERRSYNSLTEEERMELAKSLSLKEM